MFFSHYDYFEARHYYFKLINMKLPFSDGGAKVLITTGENEVHAIYPSVLFGPGIALGNRGGYIRCISDNCNNDQFTIVRDIYPTGY